MSTPASPYCPLPWYAWPVFAVYAIAIPLQMDRHAVWRDEARALTLAAEARDPWELISRTLADEGHPGLWYVLLWSALRVFDAAFALKVASYLVALAFAGLFYFRAPFPLAARALFLFGYFPFHHYSVVARNYGISWALLFFLALEYSRPRPRSTMAAGLANALLANTNIYGAICSVAFLAVPPPASAGGRGRRDRLAIGTMTLAGLVLAAFTVWPGEFNIARTPEGRGDVRPRTPQAIALSIGEIAYDSQLWGAFLLTNLDAIPRLERFAGSTATSISIPIVGVVGLAIVLLALVRSPRELLAFLLALGTAGLLARHVYPALDRHLGVLGGFLLALLWIARARTSHPDSPATSWTDRAMIAFLLLQAIVGVKTAATYWSTPYSNSRAASDFVRRSYPDAIVLCEPDVFGESLTYYLPNDLYIAREDRLARRIRLDWRFNRPLTLAELSEAAERIEIETGRPTLVSLPFRLEKSASGTSLGAYGRDLTYSADESRDFLERFAEVGRFLAPVEETYVFYRKR